MRGLRQISPLMCSILLLAACSRPPEQPAAEPADAAPSVRCERCRAATRRRRPSRRRNPVSRSSAASSCWRRTASLSVPAARKPSCGCSTRATALRRRSRDEMQKASGEAVRRSVRRTRPGRGGHRRSACIRGHVRARRSAVRRRAGPDSRLRRAGGELHRRGARHRAVLGGRSHRRRHRVAPAGGAEGDLAAARRRRRTRKAQCAITPAATATSWNCWSMRRRAATRCRANIFAYSARAVLDGKEFSGCARVGR